MHTLTIGIYTLVFWNVRIMEYRWIHDHAYPDSLQQHEHFTYETSRLSINAVV